MSTEFIHKDTKKVDWNSYLKFLNASSYTDHEFIHPYLKGVLLDVGCSFGKFISWASKLDGVTVVYGIDPSEDAVHRAQAACPQAQVRVGLAEQLPYQDGQFDVVTSFEVAEHLIQPSIFIKEAYRVLKQNGLLIIQTPNYPIKRFYDYLFWFIGKGKRYQDDPTHISPFTFRKMKHLLDQNGFEVVQLIGRNILFEKKLPFLKTLRRKSFMKYLSQKMIAIAKKR